MENKLQLKNSNANKKSWKKFLVPSSRSHINKKEKLQDHSNKMKLVPKLMKSTDSVARSNL